MSRRVGTGFIGAGLLFLTAALFLAAFNLFDERRAEIAVKHVHEEWVNACPDAGLSGTAGGKISGTGSDGAGEKKHIPDYQLNPEIAMPTIRIAGNEYIGTLEIPYLDLSLPIISAWSEERLKTAPCRYSGSAYTGDLVIAGHNYRAHFSPLKKLPVGETLRFTDVEGNTFDYRAAEMEILEADEVDAMKTGDWDLTLFTCTYGGRTRYTLRCVAVK